MQGLRIACAVALGVICNPAGAGAQVGPVLDHVGIQAADLDRSVAFYTTVLGLREIASPFPRTAARWLAFGDNRQLHIVAHGAAERPMNKWDHFALACPDLDATMARLDRSHVRWADIAGRPKPQTRGDGVRQIFLTDPDGYTIELNDAGARR